MDYALISALQENFAKKDLPELRVGMEVIVHQKIKEGDKARIQKFGGLVINMAGKTALEKVITVRHVFGGIGVEKTFPIHSPIIDKIEIAGTYKVRHKNIRFIRKLSGTSAKLKEIKAEEPKKAKAAPKKKAA